MKAVERHLYSRNGYFYYRKFLPRQIRPILPFKEIWLGLNTPDITEARMISVKLDYEFTKQVRLLQEDLSALSPEQSPEQIIERFLSKTDNIKNSFGHKPPAKISDKWKPNNTLSLLFSDVVKRYFEDCISDSYSTRFQKEATYGLFQEIMGDIPFSKIDIEIARQFKTCLLKIPANAKKLYKIKTFQGVDLDKLNGEPQHPKTINNRLAYLIALFNWAIKTGYYKGTNPFANLSIKSHKGLSVKRDTFKTDEITALFTCPIYTGCLGEEWSKRLQQGNMLIKDSLFWIPLIGLYSGLRMNEICQLHMSDIRKEDAVPVFDINDNGDKNLKTASSRRVIPIHSAITEQGFLDYIKEQKDKGEERAFPDIPLGSDKSYSSVFSKRFRRLLKAQNLKRDGLCFHSLRHTFIDGMRNAGVERAIIMAITGHQSKDVHDSYGHGYNICVLQEAINKLSFSDIEG